MVASPFHDPAVSDSFAALFPTLDGNDGAISCRQSRFSFKSLAFEGTVAPLYRRGQASGMVAPSLALWRRKTAKGLKKNGRIAPSLRLQRTQASRLDDHRHR